MLTVEQAKARLQGVCVPLATIFKDDGSVDIESTKANAQWMIDQGARQGNTIFIAAGSGGDFSALSTEERRQVITAIAEVSAGRIPIIASVQSTDIRVTIELCKLCEDMGVDVVQMSGAYYYTVTGDDMVAWVEEVARHTQVAFAAYNHWYSGSKYDMPADVCERLLEIPNTVAVKWASPSMDNYVEGLRRFVPRAAVVNNGPMVVYGHILGSKSYISHVPNFYPQQDWRVWELLEQGSYHEAERAYDEFMDPYHKIVGAVRAATAGEGVFVKPWMDIVGLRGGRSRLPSRDAAVTPEMRKEMRALLEQSKVAVAV
jgi:dihydrodipicolinate synthase/N-acetylneuraminate lyase